MKKAAEQLGVIYGTQADWRKQRTKQAEKPERRMSEEEQKAENEWLRKENAELLRANGVLKNALGFFVKDRKKCKQTACSHTFSYADRKRSFQSGAYALFFR